MLQQRVDFNIARNKFTSIFYVRTFSCFNNSFFAGDVLAVNMGGSGTASSFSAAYGANVLKQAIIPGLFGIMVLAGALIAGKEVSTTLGKGLLAQVCFTPFNTYLISEIERIILCGKVLRA